MGIPWGWEFSTMNDMDNAAGIERHPLALAIETSSRIGSVALATGDRILEEATFSGPMQHSSEIFPAIEGLLARHGRTTENIDQIHIAIGPGSFTGLRIAATAAKTMHLAQGVRIVTVDSLDVVAANVSDTSQAGRAQPWSDAVPERIVALFDAKRGEFYASLYDYVPRESRGEIPAVDDPSGYEIPAPGGGCWRKIQPDALMTARQILDEFGGSSFLGVLGDGLLYYRDQFVQANTTVLPEQYWSPHAANVFRLGYQKAQKERFDDPLRLTPLYLRAAHVTLRARP